MPDEPSTLAATAGLEPCHFCGAMAGACEVTAGPAPGLFGVICHRCGAFLDCRAATPEQAAAQWNRPSARAIGGPGAAAAS